MLLLFYFILAESFHPILYDVFTYNHMVLISFRKRYRVNASIILMISIMYLYTII